MDGGFHLATASHARGKPPSIESHVRGIDSVEKPR